MWKLLLGSQSPQVDPFIAFLNERQPVKVINRDQWQSFLEFATTVSEDFHDYDEMSACKFLLPVLMLSIPRPSNLQNQGQYYLSIGEHTMKCPHVIFFYRI
jgi:hypothetical protein